MEKVSIHGKKESKACDKPCSPGLERLVVSRRPFAVSAVAAAVLGASLHLAVSAVAAAVLGARVHFAVSAVTAAVLGARVHFAVSATTAASTTVTVVASTFTTETRATARAGVITYSRLHA
jgi:hypothetical protein